MNETTTTKDIGGVGGIWLYIACVCLCVKKSAVITMFMFILPMPLNHNDDKCGINKMNIILIVCVIWYFWSDFNRFETSL